MEASTLRTLNQFALDLIQIPSTEDLLWYVAQNVVGRLGFVDCVIYEANAELNELRQVPRFELFATTKGSILCSENVTFEISSRNWVYTCT